MHRRVLEVRIQSSPLISIISNNFNTLVIIRLNRTVLEFGDLAERIERRIGEQIGRRLPDRAARVLLTVIEHDPKAVERALAE